MDKNLIWKISLITIAIILAVLTLYPPSETLKPGLDLAGGTSLVYEIDTHGLSDADKRGIAEKMITILRRRIDPANIQNLIWRPQGDTRFEIQMPLANAEARQKRQDYEKALTYLLDQNINSAVILRCLSLPEEQRSEKFKDFAQGSSDRLEVLDNLESAYDEWKALRNTSTELTEKLLSVEKTLADSDMDVEQIKAARGGWSRIPKEDLEKALTDFIGKENIGESLKGLIGISKLDILKQYVENYAEWANAVNELTNTETGKNIIYAQAKKQLNQLSLTLDQINLCLEIPAGGAKRLQKVEEFKEDFPDRTKQIDALIAAYDAYYPFRGRLDDPKDIQRMLKGAGILEFRILPTTERPELTAGEIQIYVDDLKAKGPKFASDNNYVWCEIENIDEWKNPATVVATFGDKYYVLASNKIDEVLLQSADKKDWKLKSATPRQDQMGRRAIGFTLDERAGTIFSRVTGKNLERPLCILLDGIAISAPNIQAKIFTSGIITGSFSQVEVADMVNKLNAGSLPARLIEPPISVKTIGPSIGAVNRDKGIKAGLIGVGIVVVCMSLYYRLAGSIASAALLMNLLFVLAIMALVRATFTLPGIAGLILTIGMSVDANVLIFERIREEQKKGSSLRIAIKNGYQKAFRTIFDANLTTFITAAILFWVASEEIKGFAIVLMLGIMSSMFTALFVTRVKFDALLQKRVISDHLNMFQIVRNPNVNWMGKRHIFFIISILLVAAGLTSFLTRDNTKNNKYDIEFTGGTSVTINLKEDVTLSRQQVEDKIRKIGQEMNNPALAAASVYSIKGLTKSYEISTTETNKTSAIVTFPQSGQHTIKELTARIQKTGDNLSNLLVAQHTNLNSFEVTTSQVNRSRVKATLAKAFEEAEISEPSVSEVVNLAILEAFKNELKIKQNLVPEIVLIEKIDENFINSYPELTDFLGGVKILCNIKNTATAEEIDQRLKDLRFKPDMRGLNWYSYSILDSEMNPVNADAQMDLFTYISVEPEAGFRQVSQDEWDQFIDNEKTKLLAATTLETSLPRITQISPSIGSEAKTQALIAIFLSLFAIVAYVWVRFGEARYGIAAIVALIHDVCITLGAVTVCTYIAGTSIGELLLIGDFKISLAMIAAFLTIIGYSLNDTIVVFDRIRENRHKDRLKPQIINDSINQTLSRTLLTSFTTFIVVLIMYIFGGAALRGFTFAIGFGIIVGTYSSVAIAAPILLIGSKKEVQSKQ